MVDALENFCHLNIIRGEKTLMVALRRGHLVLASSGAVLVWSVGDHDTMCVPITKSGKVAFGTPLVRVPRNAPVVGMATGEMIEDARRAVGSLSARASGAVDGRSAGETLDRYEAAVVVATEATRSRIREHDGRMFWNGEDINQGCYWVRSGTGAA